MKFERKASSYASNNEFFYYYLLKLKVVGVTECEYINVY